MALQVGYSTTGSFTVGGTNTGSTNPYGDADGLSVFYSGVSDLFVTVPGVSAIDLGYLIVSGPSNPNTSDTVSDAFTLKITQGGPNNQNGPGSEQISDSSPSNLSGVITQSNSMLTVDFSAVGPGQAMAVNPITGLAAVTFTIGGAIYYVDAVTQLNPSTAGGFTELQGAVTASALPEPAFYGLTGAGLAGLMLVAIRRRRQGQTS